MFFKEPNNCNMKLKFDENWINNFNLFLIYVNDNEPEPKYYA